MSISTGAHGVALFENARAFVHQRVDAALDDLLGGDLALRDARFGGATSAPRHATSGSGDRAAILVIPVPSCTGLLAVAAHFAQTILGEGLTDAGFFADGDTPCECASPHRGRPGRPWPAGPWPCRNRRAPDRRPRRRALFDQKLRFAAVGTEHAVADEAAAVAHQHADLAQLLRELHAGGDHFLGCLLAAHDFKQPHHVGRTEEVRADDRVGPRGGRGDFIDVERRGVAGEDRSGLGRRGQVRRRPASSAPCLRRRPR